MGKSATPASQWKGKRQVGAGPLDLPSGNTALVKQLDPSAFLSQGIIPNPLMDIVRKAIHSKKGLPPSALNKIGDDPELMVSALLLFDRVLVNVVVEPTIVMPPPCEVEIDGELCGEYANEDVHKSTHEAGHHAYREGERDDEVLYADQVEMEDKVFIFQWCLGGTRDLQKFRQQQRANVGNLQSLQDDQVPS